MDKNLSKVFITAYQNGNLIEVINEKTRENWENQSVVIDELIKLHNQKDIDLIKVFSVLKNQQESSSIFFSIYHVVGKVIPRIDAPVSEVMECVVNLLREAGQDLAAGSILFPFVDFCSVNNSRPKEAINLIEQFSEKYYDLLPQVIIAGARLDIDFYLDKSINLAKHPDIEIRSRSIFSLGRIENLKDDDLLEKIIGCLEEIVKNQTTEQVLASAIDSSFSIWRKVKLLENRIASIINMALSKGGDRTLHTGANLFGLNKDICSSILDVFLVNLVNIKPENKGSLEYLDLGIANLIQKEDDKGIKFIENLLLKNPESLSINIFNSTMHEFFRNQNNIFDKLMTRWFIKGDRVLCDGISDIASLAHENNIQLMAMKPQFDYLKSSNIIFLARKAIGYLFSTPLTATSILISLLHFSTDKSTTQILVNLLFDFLLINYPGKVGKYLQNKIETESDEVKSNLKTTVKLFEDYFENLKSVGTIPELHPSQSQRDTYNRRFSKIMHEAMRKAQKDSVFLSLVSTAVLLYGRKSVDYVYNSAGQSNRVEIPLQAHDTEIEFPRNTNLDPFGLDYTLRVFRAERIKQ